MLQYFFPKQRNYGFTQTLLFKVICYTMSKPLDLFLLLLLPSSSFFCYGSLYSIICNLLLFSFLATSFFQQPPLFPEPSFFFLLPSSTTKSLLYLIFSPFSIPPFPQTYLLVIQRQLFYNDKKRFFFSLNCYVGDL